MDNKQREHGILWHFMTNMKPGAIAEGTDTGRLYEKLESGDWACLTSGNTYSADAVIDREGGRIG